MSEVREEYGASIDPPDHWSRLIGKLHWIGWWTQNIYGRPLPRWSRRGACTLDLAQRAA